MSVTIFCVPNRSLGTHKIVTKLLPNPPYLPDWVRPINLRCIVYRILYRICLCCFIIVLHLTVCATYCNYCVPYCMFVLHNVNIIHCTACLNHIMNLLCIVLHVCAIYCVLYFMFVLYIVYCIACLYFIMYILFIVLNVWTTKCIYCILYCMFVLYIVYCTVCLYYIMHVLCIVLYVCTI